MIRDLLRDAAGKLGGVGAGNPRLEAEYLLAQAMGIERATLLGMDPTDAPEPAACASFTDLLNRRLSREPLQYVLGTVPFAGLELQIGPGALIPRSETEVLVEETLKAILAQGTTPSACPAPRTAAPRPIVIDVGTGSGAILLALLSHLVGWRGIGIDCAPEALRWARRNAEWVARSRPDVGLRAEAGALLSRLGLLRADLLSAVRTGSVDLVISNPPYIRSEEVEGLAPEIREHEPRVALDAGPDGLDPFRRIAPEAARVLRPGGLLAVELAPDQPEPARGILDRTGAFRGFRILHDLAGRQRGLLANRA